MRIRFFLAIFVIIHIGVIADGVSLIRQAEAYYEAQDYEKARTLFSKLLEENLHHWQKERVYYNIGNTFVEQGEWENALGEYSSIDIDPSHYLLRALKTNEAILLYRRASNLLHEYNARLDDYGRALFYFRDCLKKIEEAQNAACKFSFFLGEKDCAPEEDLLLLKSAVKRELSLTLKKYGEAKILETPIKTGVPLLLSGVKIALNHLLFLSNPSLSENLKQDYLKFFVNEGNSWLTLWEVQLTQFHELNKPYQDYLAGIENMQVEKFAQSRISFLSCEARLTDLIEKLWGHDPLMSLIQNLLNSYDRALDQMPLQIFTLSQIKTEQKQVENFVKENSELIDLFQKSNHFLDESLHSSKSTRDDQARFFLYEAKQWIYRLQQLKVEKNDPKEILENAIENQMHALNLQRLRYEMKKGNQEMNESLTDSQSQTLNAASPFYSAVLNKEALEYSHRCQCKPWDQVIPLFDKGFKAAEKSMELINQGHHKSWTIREQEKTLKYWKEALEKLKIEEEEKNPPPTPNQESASSKTETPSFMELLRQLQQMNQQDTIPQPSETKPKQGYRSW